MMSHQFTTTAANRSRKPRSSSASPRWAELADQSLSFLRGRNGRFRSASVNPLPTWPKAAKRYAAVRTIPFNAPPTANAAQATATITTTPRATDTRVSAANGSDELG